MLIRNATIDDLDTAIALAYGSGPEMYDYLFKTGTSSAQDFMKFEFKSGKGLCGFNNLRLGIVNDMPVVSGSFFDKREYDRIALGTVINLFTYFGPIKAIPVIARIINIERISKAPKKGEIYLANFCVDSSMRSKGIGSEFLTQSIDAYKKEGYQVFGLDVLMSNPRAEKLYSQTGLVITEVKPFKTNRLNLHIPGSKKMEMKLQ